MRDLFEKLVENARKLSTNEHMSQMIQWKVDHTQRVVAMGNRIIDRENSQIWDSERANSALLLHDVGRFQQVFLGSYSDRETGFDHAVRGAETLVDLGVKDMEIIEAVRDHSLPIYAGNNVYTKLVKDADQLTIIGEDYQLEKIATQENVSASVMQILENGEVLDTRIVEGKIDQLLAYWNWVKNFYWQSTKDIYTEDGYETKFLATLRELDLGGNIEKWIRSKTNLLSTTVEDLANDTT